MTRYEQRRKKLASERGRKMARARWDEDALRRTTEAEARLSRYADFQITVRYLPTGEECSLSYVPDIGRRLGVLVEHLHP